MALEFNGTSHRVDLPAPLSGFNGQNGFTVAAWVLTDEINRATRQQIVAHFNGVNFQLVILENTDDFHIYVKNAGGTWPTSSWSGVQTATWYHVVATWTSGTVKLYVDGDEKDSDATEATLSTSTNTNRIGSLNVGTETMWWDGKMFDVRIYEETLSAPEIANICEAHGSDNITTDLVGRWLLDEGPDGSAATSCIDVSPQGNGGTPQNAPTYRAAVFMARPSVVRPG